MILRGSIERFDLGSVLQFLAQNAATGILEIRDYEEHGHVYLVKGRLEAISLPVTDDRLGVHLLKHGLVSEQQLGKILMEEAAGFDDSGAPTPLGERLVAQGFVNEAVVRRAMEGLIRARMFEIAHWRNGVFSYDEPERMPDFKISVQGDVQELLLHTQVRIDHGERPRKRTAPRREGDLCFGCPVSDCTPAVKLKYLKKDTCLWRSMSSPPEPSPEQADKTRRPSVNPIYGDEARNEAAMQREWGQF